MPMPNPPHTRYGSIEALQAADPLKLADDVGRMGGKLPKTVAREIVELAQERQRLLDMIHS